MAGNSKYFTPEILSSYAQKFDTAVITPAFQDVAATWVSRMIANINTYVAIQNATGVPWYFIAALHMREYGMNFNGHLHNGDPLTRRTTHVPAGRPVAAPKNGKSYTFTESAIDAIKYMGLDKWKDWSIPAMLHLFEVWNGTGYIANGRSNPYLWSGTQYYTKGKFVADGQYSANTVDKQLGAAALIKVFLNNYSVEGKKKAYSPALSGRGNSVLNNIFQFFGF